MSTSRRRPKRQKPSQKHTYSYLPYALTIRCPFFTNVALLTPLAALCQVTEAGFIHDPTNAAAAADSIRATILVPSTKTP